MSEVGIVVNPLSGGGRAGRIWERLRSAEPSLSKMRVVQDSEPAAARDNLRNLLETDLERLVVIGGDGSAHLAANTVLERGVGERPPMGLVPAGTGSDFAKALGLPHRPLAALRRVLSGDAKPVDVLRVRGQSGETIVGLNVVSAGISGIVDVVVNAMPRRGSAAYLLATLRAVRRYRPVRCRVTIDGELWQDTEILLVAVANSNRFGRGMRIAPGARLDDGEADVVVVRPLPALEVPFRLPRLYLGKHLNLRNVSMRRAKSVCIEALTPLPPLDVDGETFRSDVTQIDVIPGALRFVV